MTIIHAALAFGLLAHLVSGQGCTFTVSSSGGIACPAGQLNDGQIRLNGSEPTAEFTIVNGEITDSAGRGCIVTSPPTTQIQCDAGASAVGGFAIAADGTISYNGGAQFYGCPATDTEYNIYVDPEFGQTKCFPITLTASACRAGRGGTGSCAPTTLSTVWRNVSATVTQWSTVTVTDVITSSVPANSTTSTSTEICHECQNESTTMTH